MNKLLKGAGFYLLVFIIIVGIVQFSGKPTEKIKDLKFSEVYRELTDENISRLYFVNQTSVEGTIKDTNTKFKSYVPTEVMGNKLADEVLDQAKAGKLTFGGEAKPSTPWFVEMLPTLLLIFFMVIIWFVFMNQSQGGGGKVMSFGKSKAKVHKDDEKTRVTFKDVAGLDEEKEDLQEVVDFLKNPKKYIELGARIPKGMLMVGPPGTGKTYLSRAVAGEAGVPFFSISGSDFVEMFVGVGASRVRDLFEQAKKSAPAIIFIDEIDAVGRKRGAGLGGGHDEREQTLNQLLVEMDGFGVNQGIIIMAATNRPDILDPALLRPGRFDRQVVVGTPDVKGREAIFKVHSRNKPLSDDVKMDVLARRTPGFTPADIENLMNEAAILTARKREKKIKMETIEEAITKVIAGVAKKSKVISEKERRLTAYHEGGHAVCAHVLEEVSPVHQVTIVPRGRAGGFTMQLPVEDKFYATKNEMKENIVVLLGGRVAEELVLKDVSTGASNDLERVTATARSMVTKYGMSSKLGPMSFDSDDEVFLGNSFSSKRNYSEEVAFEIDQETKRIVDGAYDKTRSILQENMDRLEYVAQALLIYETLDAEQFVKAFNKELPLNEIENAVTEENSSKEVEEQLTIKLEKDEEVKVYVKLPSWFEIDTPIGGYNPDWAIPMEENDIKKLYFVVETKGSLDDDDLRKRERDKINCAKEHFKALESGIRYVVETDFDDIKE
ncbi:ATP-dependent zinc metalloprotease FtsH [Clostridioides difficile]|nr:ATP-dependent zinc metalloprotease FtsH [Clostridioides difficile]